MASQTTSIESERRPRSKRPLFIVLAVVLSTGAALLVADAGLTWRNARRRAKPTDAAALQAQLDFNPKALYAYDEATSYRLKPRYIGFRWGSKDSPHETNSRGLLGAAEIDPSPDVRKIAFLGDSVTYGDAVPFDRVFTSRMQAMAGTGWQLLNAGTPGWSTYQELRYYDKFLWDIPWRTVVIVFCLNDLVKFEWVWRSERALSMTDDIAVLDGLRGLRAETTKALEIAALRRKFRADPSLAPLADLNSASLRAWTADDWRNYGENVLEPWLRTKGSVPVLIVMAPTRDQLKALALGAKADDVLWPQAQMAAICTRTRTTCLDPTLDIRKLGTVEEADRLFWDDLHFTEAGHAALAAYLWPRLQAFISDTQSNK